MGSGRRLPSVRLGTLPWEVDDGQADARALRMWDTWEMPHRRWVLSAVRALNPRSVYEIGCGSGPNLRLLQTHTTVPIGGSEPFPPYARWASEHLGVPIDEAPLQACAPSEWGCIVSCYALAYVEQEDVATGLRRLREGGNKSLLLLEPVGGMLGIPVGYQQFPTEGGGRTCPGWAHDYGQLLPNSGWHAGWVWPILPTIDGINAAIVAFPG